MDHNLEDSLNLESAMGVDFDHSEDVVVSQADITLDGGTHEEGIAMEFEHIEEQPMLMDTGNEEIIDFMGDQFTLQEYSVHDDQMSGPTTTVEANQSLLSSQAETMVDLQFEQQPITVPASGVLQQDMQMPKIITVKTALPSMRPIAAKKETLVVTKTMAPRQVAIAPKPPKLTQTQATLQKISPKPGFPQTKQYAIAPKPVAKPVTLVANRSVSLVKKVSLAGTVQSSSKANTVLAQIGKQLVMMPTGGAQKIKLVTAGSGVPTVRLIGTADNEQAQLLNTQSISSSQTPKQVTKVFVQGQSNVDVSNQPAMLTKILPGNTATQQPRFLTMQQKTVPISVGGNKVILSSPSKQGAKIAKKQLIAIKSPTPKLMPAPAPQGVTTKKVVINTGQNVILKTTAPPKTGTVVKTGNTGQRTQLHQINVPGKGIQYIRLVTNSTPSVQKSTLKTQTGSTSKTFVLTDSKGNLIQMTAEKMVSGQPPPLIMSGNMSTINKLTSKPQQKLVRIAPITSKASQVMQQARAGQSLLAPLSPVVEHRAAPDEMQLEDREPPAPAPPPLFTPAPALAPVSSPAPVPAPAPAFASADMPPLSEEDEDDGEEAVNERREEEIDSKAALHALIADTVGEDDHSQDMEDTHADSMQEIEVDFERPQSAERDNSSGAEQQDSRHDEHPLIVIPSYMKQGAAEERTNYEDSRRTSGSMVSVEVEAYNPYQSPTTPPALSDSDMVSNELGLRPRKACNCTKSQCLKLYCDCFANGEFCNRCNCHNCFNNLENEELRQKAIRGCLDRNPNAFRPKIGKSKAGGPEIIRRHNKGCNCKRSGCLKNYCECYEAKIACTAICKCVGCRNVEETLERARRRDAARHTQRAATHAHTLRPPLHTNTKQPCSFMTTEVIEAVCQCLIAAAVESGEEPEPEREPDAVRDVLEEFARCLQDIISAAHQAAPGILVDEPHA